MPTIPAKRRSAVRLANVPWQRVVAEVLALLPHLTVLLVFPLLLHLAFSPLGFNPSDQGFTLAYSRRILDGQIPHRDFITIRPAGSPLFHVPEVFVARWYANGSYTFLLERLVMWFEFTTSTWCFLLLTQRLTGVRLPGLVAVACAVIALTLSVHNFPAMAWHTVDGLFMTAVGMLLASRESARAKLPGYFFLGAAALMKQNFAVVAPLAALVLGDWRRPWIALPAILPPLLYAGTVTAAGGFTDMREQLGTQSDLVAVGWRNYIREDLARWLLVGAAAVVIRERLRWGWAGFLILMGYGILKAVTSVDQSLPLPIGFWLFGLGAGALLAMAARASAGDVQAVLIGLAVGWTASISVGYNSPLLGAAAMVAPLLVVGWHSVAALPWGRWSVTAGMVALALLAALNLHETRRGYIYREQPAEQLVYDLDGMFPGAARIRTNHNMYLTAQDLQRAVAMTGGRRYAIIPDFAAYWVQADQANPLLIDWPLVTELANPAVEERLRRELEAQRGELVVIVQKFTVTALSTCICQEPVDSPLVPYVREHFTRIGETDYFELYE